jgi:hypothetical protein
MTAPGPGPHVISEPLTTEIARIQSPVRRFLDERFRPGLRAVQRRYREPAPGLVVPPADPGDLNPRTTGTAADWLLRFLVHSQPDMHLPLVGVLNCAGVGINLLAAFAQVLDVVGIPRSLIAADLRTASGAAGSGPRDRFTGPAAGTAADPVLLYRTCWATALLTEVFRGGPGVAVRGPLGRFAGRRNVTGDELLAMTPPPAAGQMTLFREVFTTVLLPQLADCHGLWGVGSAFTGSALISADADLIAAGLLLDLKTSAQFALPPTDLYQVIGYTLLDFNDEFGVNRLGIFSARYGHLTTWDAPELLRDLAGRDISLEDTRREFKALLLASKP